MAKVQFNTKIAEASQDIRLGLETKNKLTFLVGQALEKDNAYFRLSVDSIQDASSKFLQDYIVEKLVVNGIDTNFSYSLHTQDLEYYLNSPENFDSDDSLSTYPIELLGYFPNLLGSRVVLELKFNNLNQYLLSKLNGLTLPSILFLLGICIAVIWALRTYYWQRNLITTTNEFINNLTHELKTPVFSIGLASKILDKSATDSQKPILDIIRQQVHRLSTHIDKVLELGNLESGKNILTLELVDFRPHLEKLCQEFQTLVSIENACFFYDLQKVPYWINAEVFHLENAINNILDNAKKYSNDPEILLSAAVIDHKLKITIQDNGIGISKMDKERIFQKYFRVTNGDIHDVKGYGLGLSYVKKVMDKHKGKVMIESDLGKGTIITLLIPIQDA